MLSQATYGREPQRYVSMVADSGRWAGFEHREGDIVISTPSKSGTTWTQMLVALLVFDGPDFPDSLGRVSPWLDMDNTALPEILDRLAAQTHRRFIKTHAPLDGFPLDERVSYVVVGRDPRDVFLSMGQHFDNIEFDTVMARLAANVGAEELGRRMADGPPTTSFAEAIDLPPGTAHTAAHPAHVTQHLWDAWRLRDEPNLLMLHYADMRADITGEFGRLATALGYDVPSERLAELAAHADFSAMKSRSTELAPEADAHTWKSNDDFFRAGRMGAWAEAFDRPTLERYQDRMTELFPDEEFLSWVHGGRRDGDWRV